MKESVMSTVHKVEVIFVVGAIAAAIYILIK